MALVSELAAILVSCGAKYNSGSRYFTVKTPDQRHDPSRSHGRRQHLHYFKFQLGESFSYYFRRYWIYTN